MNVLFYALPLLLCFAVYSAFMMLLRWKTADRKKHAIRLGLSLVLMPVVDAMIYCVTFFVLVPDVMSDLVAENETRPRKRFDDTTIVKVGGQAPELQLRTFDGRNISVPDNGERLRC